MPQRPTMSSGARLGRGMGPADCAGGGGGWSPPPQLGSDNEGMLPEHPASANATTATADDKRNTKPPMGGLLHHPHPYLMPPHCGDKAGAPRHSVRRP